MPLKIYRDSTGQIDYTKIPETLFFSMKRFTTNRSFNNLFGKNIDIIKKRVNFFKQNKDWYDNKGVPYTLGIMVSGSPGAGKTSIIKCISNELKRHIINIHLSDNMTKLQLENLVYSEQINILQNGKTETYTIPIDKRIYVLEDVDCQCDIVLDRASETVEQLLIKKNEDLKKQIEELKTIINNRSNNTKIINSNENIHKQGEINNQKITLSFLLNLFDGILETPGRITIMTTNFIDKLDKAFTRPGRIDVISKFGFSDAEQLIQIIEHRYDAKLTEEQLNLIYNIPNCITPAEVGRLLFENFNDLDGSLKALISYSENFILQQQEKMAEATKNKEIVEEIDKANEKIAKQQIEENEENQDINNLPEQYKYSKSLFSKEKIKPPVHNKKLNDDTTMMSSGENVILSNDEITHDEIKDINGYIDSSIMSNSISDISCYNEKNEFHLYDADSYNDKNEFYRNENW
jgi:SpoVK/Ycf46/Vps4 family AAA+-type ATPase